MEKMVSFQMEDLRNYEIPIKHRLTYEYLQSDAFFDDFEIKN